MKIHFLDSSVFCNLLAIPGKSDRAEETKAELDLILKNKERERIILPFATIIETGNHISHISDGNVRYNTAAFLHGNAQNDSGRGSVDILRSPAHRSGHRKHLLSLSGNCEARNGSWRFVNNPCV